MADKSRAKLEAKEIKPAKLSKKRKSSRRHRQDNIFVSRATQPSLNPDKRLKAKLAAVKKRQADAKNDYDQYSGVMAEVLASQIDQIKNPPMPLGWRIARVIGWCLWTVAGWFIANVIIGFVLALVRLTTGHNLLAGDVMMRAGIQTLVSATMLFVVIGVPWLLNRHSRTWHDVLNSIGWRDHPSSDNLLRLTVVAVVYYVTIILAGNIVEWIARAVTGQGVMSQAQNIGFAATGNNWGQVISILILLTVITPIAEETLFRGYLFGHLRQLVNFPVAAVIVSLIFAVMHGQLNVGITTFALSMYSCYLREKTGSIWSSIGLHAIANGVAAFIIYVVPMLR